MGRYSSVWAKGLHIVEMSVLPNLIYTFIVIQVRISANIFVDIDMLILKLV